MTSPPRDKVNPYASPIVSDPTVVPTGEVMLGVHKPQVRPRDAIDVLVGGGFGTVVAAIVYGIPIAMAIVARAPAIAVIGVIFVVSLAIVVMMSGIQSITITETALKVRRLLRRELVIEWSTVVSIRQVTRWEAIAASVLSVTRMCPQSFTSSHYFRIDTGNTFILFPPKHPATFQATVETLWSASHGRAIVPIAQMNS
jgi:hypothetical protein